MIRGCVCRSVKAYSNALTSKFSRAEGVGWNAWLGDVYHTFHQGFAEADSEGSLDVEYLKSVLKFTSSPFK